MDEGGFVNALVSYKNVEAESQKGGTKVNQTIKPVLTELERVLHSNLPTLSLPSLAQLLYTYSAAQPINPYAQTKTAVPALTQKLNDKVVTDLKDH